VPSISTRGRDRCGADDLSCVGSNLAVRGVTPRQHIAGSLTACTALTPEFSEATFPHTRLSQSAALRDRRVLPPRLPCRWLCAGWRRLWACANCSYTARRRSRRRGPRDGHARNFQPSRGRAFSRTLDDIADPVLSYLSLIEFERRTGTTSDPHTATTTSPRPQKTLEPTAGVER
jgi:hypothetical protein